MNSRWASSTQYTISDLTSTATSGTNTGGGGVNAAALTQAHGALMLAAWATCVPVTVMVAVTVARHMRLTLPFTKLLLGYKLWVEVRNGILKRMKGLFSPRGFHAFVEYTRYSKNFKWIEPVSDYSK